MFGVHVNNLDNIKTKDKTVYCPEVRLVEMRSFPTRDFVYVLTIPGDKNTANGVVFRTEDNEEYIMCNLDTSQIKDILKAFSTDKIFDFAKLPYKPVPVDSYLDVYENMCKSHVCIGNLTSMDTYMFSSDEGAITNIYNDYRLACVNTMLSDVNMTTDIVDYKDVWPNALV